MLFTSLFVAAATFSSFASAQNETNPLPPGIQPCCTVDPNVIPDDLKTGWCQAQRNTCPEICGGVPELARGGQSCDQDTLEYTCECRNGTKPDMALYQQSVPGQMCRFWFDQCINATDENLEFQVECQAQRDSKCGNLTTSDADETSTASAEPTATPTGGDSEESGSPTGAPSESPTGAANTLALARNYGTPLLAGGIAAVFGLAL